MAGFPVMLSAMEPGKTKNSSMVKKMKFTVKVKKDWSRNKSLYVLIIPVLAFYVLFMYKPMYGALIAFKDYSPVHGFGQSPWVGFANFSRFIHSIYFWRLIRNTFWLSFLCLLWGFPAPIILAIMINEVKNKPFKKTVQTLTYLPHFISMVVVCGMIADFCVSSGLINDLVVSLGGTREPMLQDASLFRIIYVASNVWQQIGWGSIIYLAALSGIDGQLYEAAKIDGAGWWKQLWNVTLPGIAPVIIIMLLLQIGRLMSLGYEKTILLYNPSTYETADIISSYVYRVGLIDQDWSYSTAVGLFNSVINMILLFGANRFSKKYSETSLW
jgi:putative aldouronate transport system permease protein